jgi:quercetin dioxygenase-like cupin family protein
MTKQKSSIQRHRADGDADVFAALAQALKPQPVPKSLRDRQRAAMLGRLGAENASTALTCSTASVRLAVAPAPDGTQTWRSSEVEFAPGSPLIESKVLRVDKRAGTQEALIRFLPGAVVPAHSHAKEEEMIILEGECFIGEHALRAGDVHIAPPGSWHPAITAPRGTLLLLRCEYPFPTNR